VKGIGEELYDDDDDDDGVVVVLLPMLYKYSLCF